MKLPMQKLIKSAARKRAQERQGAGGQAPAPKRRAVRAPEQQAPPEPPAAIEVDLTADTPPEEMATGEVTARVVVREEPMAAEEPAIVEEPVAAEEPSATEVLATAEEPAAPEFMAPGGPASPTEARDWGEGPSGEVSPPPEQGPSGEVSPPPEQGPSGEVSPPPEQGPASSPPRAESETAEDSGGARAKSGPPRDSILNDGRWARKLLSSIRVPAVQEELSHLKAGMFFQESYAAIVRIANSMMATQEAIHGGKKVLREVQKEADEARARAEAAERTLESERVARATDLKTAESRAEAEARRLRAALSQLMEAESVATARSLHISELNSSIQAAEGQASEAEGRARSAEERARRAEEKAERAEEMAKEANERAAAAECKLRAAEEEVDRSREAERAATASLAAEIGARVVEVEAALEGRVAQAIEKFRASEQFVDELVAASTDAFSQGFQHGKEKVARDLNFPAALEVEPESLSEAGTPMDEPTPGDQ